MKNFTIISVVFVLMLFCSLRAEDTIRYDIYYFHATIRCEGCLVIEDYVKNSVNHLFENELKEGKITLTSLDFQEEQNEHYQDDYKFDVQTLIISKKVNNKEVAWKNFEFIWDYSSDYDKFSKYIKDEINDFISNNEGNRDEY